MLHLLLLQQHCVGTMTDESQVSSFLYPISEFSKLNMNLNTAQLNFVFAVFKLNLETQCYKLAVITAFLCQKLCVIMKFS